MLVVALAGEFSSLVLRADPLIFENSKDKDERQKQNKKKKGMKW